MDPSLQIDVLAELRLPGSAAGVRQVPGLHNGSKAFLFPGTAPSGSPSTPSSSSFPHSPLFLLSVPPFLILRLVDA